jgi:hypothetical protein
MNSVKGKIIDVWGLGIGDWGLGIGDWAQSPIPNPQSPIPNPHFISQQSMINQEEEWASTVQNDNEYTVIPKSPKQETPIKQQYPNLQRPSFPRENKLQNNQYATPVQIQSNVNNSEAGFETPVIIPRKDKVSNIHAVPNVQPIKLHHEVPVGNLKGELEKDIKTFMAQFDNAKDKQERTEICKKGE